MALRKLVALISVVVGITLLAVSQVHPSNSDVLKVSFLDVGQGDAIFIETPNGEQVLIDGGPDSDVLYQLEQVMPWWDRSIDMVIATHPDKDHIGGLVDVLDRYQVDTYIDNGMTADSSTGRALQRILGDFPGERIVARRGMVIDLDADIRMIMLSPEVIFEAADENNASVITHLMYNETQVLLTGDAGVGVEEYLVETYGENLQSDILKLGHHGSDTSTSENFLATVQPHWAIVSAGIDNSYGHPHAEVVDRVKQFGSEMLSTAEQGIIQFYSDGQTWQTKD